MAIRSESHKENTQKKLRCLCDHCAVYHLYKNTFGMFAVFGDFSAGFRLVLTALEVMKLVLWRHT